MSLRARIDRLFEAMGWGELWDGASMEDLAKHGYLSEKKWSHEPIPHGVQRMAMFASLYAVKCALSEPTRRRTELEETRKTDIFRRERGWQPVLRDGREEKWLEDIASAEAEALDALARIGLSEYATPEQIAATLLALGRENGFTEAEMAKLLRSIRAPEEVSG